MNDRFDSVPLREYIERILDERERAVMLARAAEQRALDQRERNIDARLEKLNELRAEVLADRAQFMKFDTYTVQHKALEDKVDVLSEVQIRNETKYVTLDKFEPLEDMRSKFTAIIAGSMAVAGVIGALAGRMFS